MSTLTNDELFGEMLRRINHLDVRDDIECRAYEIAMASLAAEPIAWMRDDADGREYNARNEFSGGGGGIPLYATPQVQVVPEEMYWQDAPVEGSSKAAAYATGWNACRAAMLQGIQPVSQTYNLPELIEGMEVSIDVSTCDADLGNRYFGTVTEALELDTAKNGYILLVQDAEPNFDVNGNSPVTPDGWISCSERMPSEEDVLVYCSDTKEQMVGFHKGKGLFQFFYMNGVEGVCEPSHWMTLPEPPL
ncbi:DUF551 domain-containing protein [Escherichia coli]|nr:DUF551 domain-containing protein [Escherichia coli]